MSNPRVLLLAVFAVLSGCATTSASKPGEKIETAEPAPKPDVPQREPQLAKANPELDAALTCNGSAKMKVHFFDVEQALAVLVELPDGQTILVDTGESRPGSADAYEHLRGQLDSLLSTKKISMVWITHQHADHLGRIKEVLARYSVGVVVHNGTSTGKDQVRNMKTAAQDAGTPMVVVDPSNSQVPLSVASPITLSAVVPNAWSNCDDEPNDCSIGLRIDYCNSSVIFLGDSETHEEASFPGLKAVTVLQAPHHGSKTSSTDGLLTALTPKYVVISSGKPREGLNKGICHPNRTAVQRLSGATNGTMTRRLWVFRDDLKSCDRNDLTDRYWEEMSVSDTLFSTARDGDVTMTTKGDGNFDVSVAK